MSTIGTHIKARRKYLKISQRQLADLSEVSINTITKIERNEGNPTLDVLEKVLDTLGMELTTRVKNISE